MRILIVNTSDRTGGAAVAARRLMDALNNNGEKAKMLVRDKQSDDITVAELGGGVGRWWHFLSERWSAAVALRFSRDHLFEIDFADSGTDITKTPEFIESDIIHLHWINQGMLSLGGIKKIVRSGKPIVWTMHDLWPATGICHYAGECVQFRTGCRRCPLLPGGGADNDVSAKVWRRKAALYRSADIHFVACSRWIEEQARSSALLAGQRVSCVPNAIDTDMFAPRDKAAARTAVALPNDKKIILFAAHKVTDPRKGMSYFADALRQLVAKRLATPTDTVVAVLGSCADEMLEQLPLTAYPLGYITDEHRIADVYNAADMYVLPSLGDNLPNTIMEAMACGVPCVGFRTGGIPEMIDHRRNGYIAAFADAADLAAGIEWVLFEADNARLSHAAASKVRTTYSRQSVAMKYISVYEEAVAMRRYIR